MSDICKGGLLTEVINSINELNLSRLALISVAKAHLVNIVHKTLKTKRVLVELFFIRQIQLKGNTTNSVTKYTHKDIIK